MSSTTPTTISLQLPKGLLERVDMEADRELISRAAVIRRILAAHLGWQPEKGEE